MDMNTIGYYLYMQECEKQQDQAEDKEVNVNFSDLLEPDRSTPEEK